MNKFSEQQIEEFKKLDNLYKKNAELLCYEEILEDEAKTLFLTKQNSKIKKIVFLFAKLRELEKQKEEIKALINDNNFIELVKQEQNVLEEQIANCEDDLQQEYNIYLNNKEEITIEMFNIENGDKILEILKQSIINNCKKNNFQYCLNDDGLSFRVVGYNSFNIFEKLCGVHKSEDEKQVAKLIVYYTINRESFNEKDEIKIDVYKSSGAGGQHINKTESAIRVTHIKTGIVVTCQDERTQFQNKEKALFNLKVKVNEYYKQKYEQDVKNSKEKQLKETTISKVVLKYNFNTNKVEGLVNTTFNDFINAKY